MAEKLPKVEIQDIERFEETAIDVERIATFLNGTLTKNEPHQQDLEVKKGSRWISVHFNNEPDNQFVHIALMRSKRLSAASAFMANPEEVEFHHYLRLWKGRKPKEAWDVTFRKRDSSITITHDATFYSISVTESKSKEN